MASSEESKLGLAAAPDSPAMVEDLREDSTFETKEQRKEILRAFVDVETTGVCAFVAGGPCSYVR